MSGARGFTDLAEFQDTRFPDTIFYLITMKTAESMSAANHFSSLIINIEEDGGALKTFISQENKKSNRVSTEKAIRFQAQVDKSAIISSFISSDRKGRCMNLKLFMPVSSSIFFRTIARKRCCF